MPARRRKRQPLSEQQIEDLREHLREFSRRTRSRMLNEDIRQYVCEQRRRGNRAV